MLRLRILSGLFALCAIFGQSLAHAQELDNVEERLPDGGRASPQSDQRRETDLPQGLDALDAAASGEALLGRFVLTAVDISGASAIAPERFAPLYDGLLAKYVTVADVTGLAEEITRLYREEGYFLSRAVIPAQNIEDGVLKVRIVEGYIDVIDVEGFTTPDIEKRFAKVTAERPLRMATLERTLALTGDLPGVKVLSSKIEPREDDMARHRLVIEIAHDRFEAGLYADNRGTEDAGVLQTYLSLAARSLIQTGDQLTGGVFFTPADPGELTLGQVSYATPIGRDGAVFRMLAMTSYFDAGGPREATQTESRTMRLNASLAYPVIRRRRLTLWASAGVEARNFEEEQLGATRFNDKLRSVYASATLRAAHLDGVSSITGAVERGLDIFNASTDGALSRSDATGQFTKFTAEVTRLQNLDEHFSVYVSAAAQVSLDPLLASEEFALGGARYGRAYDYGEFKGDDGVATSAELRYTRQPGVKFLKSYQVYGFYDYGAVWNENVSPQYEKLDLSSTGAGARLTFSNGLRVNVEIAKPLDGAPFTQGDQSWRGFFSISKSF